MKLRLYAVWEFVEYEALIDDDAHEALTAFGLAGGVGAQLALVANEAELTKDAV
jgi:hypothetical protein